MSERWRERKRARERLFLPKRRSRIERCCPKNLLTCVPLFSRKDVAFAFMRDPVIQASDACSCDESAVASISAAVESRSDAASASVAAAAAEPTSSPDLTVRLAVVEANETTLEEGNDFTS